MACDCIFKLEKELRDNLGDPLAKLNGVFHFVGNQMQCAPTVEVIYRYEDTERFSCEEDDGLPF